MLITRTLLTLMLCSAFAGCLRSSIDAMDEHGMTALMRAAAEGNVDVAQSLLRRGANVNATVPSNDLQVIIGFLEFMQPVPKHEVGRTPLVFACAAGHIEVAKILIAAGADVNMPRDSDSALFQAAYSNNPELVQLLLASGARPNPQSGAIGSVTPLTAAAGRGNVTIVRLLLRARADVNLDRGLGLLAATRAGSVDIVREFVAAGADVNAPDSVAGWTPLEWAVHSGHEDVAQVLRAAGARSAGTQNVALLSAINRGDAAGVQAALRSGASVNARDEHGYSAISVAAQEPDAAIASALIAAGADPNADDRSYAKPLYLAAQHGYAETVAALIAGGASVRPSDGGALAAASSAGYTDVVRELLAARVDPNESDGEPLRAAAMSGREDVARLLLDSGANPNLTGDAEMTALMRAVGNRRAVLVQMLLRAKADVNARGSGGMTPLIFAASAGDVQIVRTLLAAGADVNARDDEGKTALDYAEQLRYFDAASELQRAGAQR